ncbi:thioredoxin family protein [Sutcliffiella cohnii]|uniref:thioredoxin family protein n=1 Tax=Sutcliffiella cohnii TaxID=33932 RepID=UPI002E1AE809|nr:thioredoxin family protein [Sutcliffiella cohnii]
MNEWTREKLLEEIEGEEALSVVYFYTPMCGTCGLASKMLNVTKELFPNLVFGQIDVNYARELALKWEIESVPCVIVFYKGELLEKKYALQSVEHLYHWFNELQSKIN